MAEQLEVLSTRTFCQSWRNVNREVEEDGQLCIAVRLLIYKEKERRRSRDEQRKERITMISMKGMYFYKSSRLDASLGSMTRYALMLHQSCQVGVLRCPCPIRVPEPADFSLFMVKRRSRMRVFSVSGSRVVAPVDPLGILGASLSSSEQLNLVPACLTMLLGNRLPGSSFICTPNGCFHCSLCLTFAH